MVIKGKLFGVIGHAGPVAPSPASETALPGYRAWYSALLARSYAARSGDETLLAFVPISPRFALPLAA
jgi:hypothetical protein